MKYFDEIMDGTSNEDRLDENGNIYLHTRSERRLKPGEAEMRRNFLDQNVNGW